MTVNMDRRPLPEVSDPITEEFFEGCARGELLVQRCADAACGHRQFFPRWCCTRCGGAVEWMVGSGRGTVHTYTIIRQNHAEPFRSELPFVVAMIELEEGPRMMSNVTDIDPETVTIGMPVEVHFAASDDGSVTLPFFRPVGAGASAQ
jgi:uncharacterized OB-fold protein